MKYITVRILANPLRFVPIPYNRPPQNISTRPHLNATYTPPKTVINQTPVIHTVSQGPDLWFLPLILIGVFTALVIVILYSYYRYGEGRPATATVYLGGTSGQPVFVPTVQYVYTGIKAVLRKYLVQLRRIMGCTTCTPRELSMRGRDKCLNEFAYVYEEVVYGSKVIGRVSEVLEKIRRRLGGYE